jgi:geranylgeranyl transferase type-2 subunit beta
MATRHAVTPEDLGPFSKLLVDKHAAYIASFANVWEVRVRRAGTAQRSPRRSAPPHRRRTHLHCSSQSTDKLEHVATEHFWMSGMYWGLTAMALLGRLRDMDTAKVLDWVRVMPLGAAAGRTFVGVKPGWQ